MIPKKINYCWFGNNEIPETTIKCIESWKKYCPDYEIIKWNEDNFDVSSHPYMEEAYKARKWAFVSDVARLLIIYEHGGIYLDTDVELIAPLGDIIDNSFYFAIEKNTTVRSGEANVQVATGLGFGAEVHNKVLKSMIDEYEDVSFELSNGTYDLTPCPIRNSNAIRKYGWNGKDEMFRFEGGTLYPSEYFCPEEYCSYITHYSNNTRSIHHFDASWRTHKQLMLDKLVMFVRRGLHIFLKK